MFSSKFSVLHRSKGFTLIEILVVITIIGILSSVLITAINPIAQRNKGRDAQRKADVRQIQSALEFYRSDAGSYPASVTCNQAISYNGTTYMSKAPCTPDGSSYRYSVNAASTTYCLRACMENSSDIDRDEVNPKYGNHDAPTPAQMGTDCVDLGTCANGKKTYTVLNP